MVRIHGPGPRCLGALLAAALGVGCGACAPDGAGTAEVARAQAPALAAALRSGPLDDFRLTDHAGISHGLGYYADEGRVTLIGLSVDCAETPAILADTASRLAAPAAGRHFFVAADAAEPRVQVAALVAEAGLEVPVLMDSTETVSASVGLLRAGDVVEVDLQAFTWERVADGPESCPNPVPDGAAVSYVDDVVPVLQALCFECHSDNKRIPLMSDYDTLFGWSAMIRRTVRTQRMPPGGHDPFYGAVKNGHTPAQLATLVAWIDAGSPRGEGVDPLPALNAAEQELSLREAWGPPDRVFRMAETHTLPAAGPDQYRYAQVSEPLDQDLWVRGIRLVLNVAATHHVNLILLDQPLAEAAGEFVKKSDSDMLRLRKVKGDHHHYEPDTEDSRLLWANDLGEERILMTYGRSKRTVDFEPGMALRIPAGSVLVLEIHYGLTGKEETSDIKVLMYEHDDALPLTEVKRASFYRTGFKIPPGAKDHTVRTGIELDRDITLLEVVPHMHRRGRSARYSAVFPDGREEVLVSIPFFQYKFQPHWALAEPRELPAGTRLVTELVYDNSAQNPINPDPEAWVENGNQRIEEMHLPRFYFLEGLHGGG